MTAELTRGIGGIGTIDGFRIISVPILEMVPPGALARAFAARCVVVITAIMLPGLKIDIKSTRVLYLKLIMYQIQYT